MTHNQTHDLLGHFMPRPGSLTMRMDITEGCNLRCRHCPWAVDRVGLPPAYMSLDLFRSIAAQMFPYCRLVALSCIAEPLIHPHLAQILEIVKQTPGPIYFITTNGVLLKERVLRQLIDADIAGIALSVDGATPETVAKCRSGVRLADLLENLETLDRLKRELGRTRLDWPSLQLNYTLMRSTLHELPLMAELCDRYNVRSLTCQFLHSMEKTGLADEALSPGPEADEALLRAAIVCESLGVESRFPDFHDPQRAAALRDSFKAEAAIKFKEQMARPPIQPLGVPGERYAGSFIQPTLEPQDIPMRCLAPWRMLRLDWRGQVVPCDVWCEAPLGDLSRQSFEELWCGESYRKLRSSLGTGEAVFNSCRHCGQAISVDDLEGRRAASARSAGKPA